MGNFKADDPKLLKFLDDMYKAIDSHSGDQKRKEEMKKTFSEQVISGYVHDGCLPSHYSICKNGKEEIVGFGIGYGKLDERVNGLRLASGN